MTVPEYLRHLSTISWVRMDEAERFIREPNHFAEIAARWEKMERALKQISKGTIAMTGRRSGLTHLRRVDMKLLAEDVLLEARAPLGEEGKDDD